MLSSCLYTTGPLFGKNNYGVFFNCIIFWPLVVSNKVKYFNNNLEKI